MASTYTWANALTVVKPYVKSIPTGSIEVAVCDQLNSFIFKAKIWKWSIASLVAIPLVDGTQDYSPGAMSGSGLYRLLRVRITRSDVTPDTSRELSILEWLTPNLTTFGPESIRSASWEASASKIRLEAAASVPAGVTYQIDGEYQFAPLKVTSTSSTIIFPDHYFDVAVEGLKWKFYQLGDYSGEQVKDQRAVFMGLLDEMKRNEDYGDGEAQRFPDEPIGAGRGGYRGWF